MFLVNSRFPLVSAAHTRSPQHVGVTGQAPLLPKLRGHFAEFLNHDSLVRLGILYQITCVGFGYGQLEPHVDVFLGSTGSPDHPPIVGAHQVSAVWCTDLPIHRPTLLDQVDSIAWPGYLSASHLLTRLPPQIGSHAAHTSQLLGSRSSVVGVVSIIASIWAVLRRYGNINPLSIDYACRPRLRSRLTQGRLA